LGETDYVTQSPKAPTPKSQQKLLSYMPSICLSFSMKSLCAIVPKHKVSGMSFSAPLKATKDTIKGPLSVSFVALGVDQPTQSSIGRSES
jgi:hypothetical protein